MLAFALAIAACGGEGGSAADESSAAEDPTSDAATATTAAATAQTTTAAPTTTEPPTTTEAPATTAVEETTTTTEPPPTIPNPPPAGTGVLTVDGEEFPFTVETCSTEPVPFGSSILMFEVRGATTAEGQAAEARLFRLAPASGGAPNDSFGWGYATDPDDFESVVSVGSPFGIGAHILVTETEAGTTFYGPPIPFERTEGISVVDDVDPGVGSIIATC